MSNRTLRAGRPSSGKTALSPADVNAKPATERVRVNFDLDREKHEALKHHAISSRKSVTDILRDLVDQVLAKHSSK